MLPVPGEVFSLRSNDVSVVKCCGLSPHKWVSPTFPANSFQEEFFFLTKAEGTEKEKIGAVQAKLLELGAIPEGHWIVALCKQYQGDKGDCSIGVADPSWLSPLNESYFPCRLPTGKAELKSINSPREGDWFWLVQVPHNLHL